MTYFLLTYFLLKKKVGKENFMNFTSSEKKVGKENFMNFTSSEKKVGKENFMNFTSSEKESRQRKLHEIYFL